MTATLFRFTNSTDTIGGLANTEKIDFNSSGSGVPDSTGNLTYPSLEMPRNINFHPNPRKPQNRIQDALLSLTRVTLTGYFVNHKNTLGPTNLHNWQIDPATNDDFPFGRFGLELTESVNSIMTLTPSITQGYILENFKINDIEDPRTEVQFIITLLRNGTPVTISLPEE